jgi:hypothetical protein
MVIIITNDDLSGVLLAMRFAAIWISGVVEGGEDVLVAKDGQRGAGQAVATSTYLFLDQNLV